MSKKSVRKSVIVSDTQTVSVGYAPWKQSYHNLIFSKAIEFAVDSEFSSYCVVSFRNIWKRTGGQKEKICGFLLRIGRTRRERFKRYEVIEVLAEILSDGKVKFTRK